MDIDLEKEITIHGLVTGLLRQIPGSDLLAFATKNIFSEKFHLFLDFYM